MPLASSALVADLEIHFVGRAVDEFLLYGKNDPLHAVSRHGQNRWFKRCLKHAELPASIQMHELGSGQPLPANR